MDESKKKLKEWHDSKSISLASEICETLYNVIDWGREKGLNDPKAQLNKVMEEVGEIAHEITRNKLDTPELEDAIGDTLVTVIILSDILGIDPMGALDEAYNVIKDRKGTTEKGTFVRED